MIKQQHCHSTINEKWYIYVLLIQIKRHNIPPHTRKIESRTIANLINLSSG